MKVDEARARARSEGGPSCAWSAQANEARRAKVGKSEERERGHGGTVGLARKQRRLGRASDIARTRSGRAAEWQCALVRLCPAGDCPP